MGSCCGLPDDPARTGPAMRDEVGQMRKSDPIFEW